MNEERSDSETLCVISSVSGERAGYKHFIARVSSSVSIKLLQYDSNDYLDVEYLGLFFFEKIASSVEGFSRLVLLGWSFSGVVVAEVARLARVRLNISLKVILIDPPVPGCQLSEFPDECFFREMFISYISLKENINVPHDGQELKKAVEDCDNFEKFLKDKKLINSSVSSRRIARFFSAYKRGVVLGTEKLLEYAKVPCAVAGQVMIIFPEDPNSNTPSWFFNREKEWRKVAAIECEVVFVSGDHYSMLISQESNKLVSSIYYFLNAPSSE